MAGRELLIGVTGGVAAYKSAALVSQLVQSGAGVTVVMTAQASHFIGPATFAALTGRAVVHDLFDSRFPLGAHIELAQRADLLCVAPATANFLAKAALGLADDLLSTLYLCFDGPVLMAPAMNCEMWERPAVQRNLEQLRQDQVRFIGPDEGWLSCRRQGQGRMSAPEAIAAQIHSILDSSPRRPRVT
jgi:phosphopantothenoylcysteine decarboxylase/phosphopantothenate--cysteine ligase